jgi:hypothetical protein
MSLFGKLFGGLGGAKKTNESGTSSFDKTTTPIVPDWLQQPTQDLVTQNMALGARDPSSYVAGSNPLLDQAQAGAGGLTGTPWAYDASTDLARGVSNTSWADPFVNGDGGAGAKGSSYIQDYMNPYQKQVVDATSADLTQNEGKVRAQQSLDLARNGAFGGSGAALTRSGTEGELARARASSIGGILSHGFDTAVAAGQGDAGRYLQDQGQRFGFGIDAGNQRLAAGGQIAQNANDYGANLRANVGVQQGVGDAARGVEQDRLGAPLDLASWQVQNMPPWIQAMFGEQSSGTGATTGTTSTPFNLGTFFGNNAKLAASVFGGG